MEEVDRISPVFKNRHIFITGGTGFLGKVLVEKILRDTEVGKIYILIRPKKGVDSKDRVLKMIEDPLFDKLKTEMSVARILDKLVVINGDCGEIGAGISKADRQLIINNVTFIYHLCANIRFDEVLKKAVEINTRGTREIIDLALECKRLEIFIYVSTCYCHLKEKILFEKSYPSPKDPHEIIKLVERLSTDEVEKQQHLILDYYPNTYAFTKALSEGLVNEARDKKGLKALLIRPSIVIQMLEDPLAGWTNNLNGVTGLMVAYGRGALRSVHVSKDTYGDFLPVDVCVHGIMVATWNYITNNDKKRNVLNFATSNSIGRYTYKDLLEIGQKCIREEYPFGGSVLWYPHCKFTSSLLLHKIRAFYKHWIPAILIDALLACFGCKPIMMNVQRRLAKGLEVFDYYSTNNWEFDNTNCLDVFKLINSEEAKKYFVKIHEFKKESVAEALRTNIWGIRRYLLKEPDETLPSSKKLLKIMYILDMIVSLLFYGLIFYFVLKYMIPIMGKHLF